MFRRAYLDQWPEIPVLDEDAAVVIPVEVWRSRLDDERGMRLGPVAFGVAVSQDRRHAFVGAAGRRVDGRVQVNVAARGGGVAWVVDWVASRMARWSPVAVVLSGTAVTLQVALEERGVPVVTTSSSDRAQASAGFFDDLVTGVVLHPGEPLLDKAAEAAGQRFLQGGFVWDGPGVEPLEAVTLAHAGLLSAPPPQRAAPPPRVDRAVQVSRSETSDLAYAGF
jgi:hypothetical protein